jgi:hypothetical protein
MPGKPEITRPSRRTRTHAHHDRYGNGFSTRARMMSYLCFTP